MQLFQNNYHRAYENYALGIAKALDHFEREMLKYNGLDTTTIWMSSFCSEMRNMVKDMKQKISEFDDLLYFPCISFTKNYVDKNKRWIDESKRYISEVEGARRQVQKARTIYEKRCEMKKEWEDLIELKIKEHEEGLITFEVMQEAANKAVNVKYKAEVSLQDYKHDVEYLNNLISEANKRYKPSLDSLQKYEEKRIEFIKTTMQSFLKYYWDWNLVLLEKETKFGDSIKMINSYTDLQIFVDEHRSRTDKDSLLSKMTVHMYEPSKAYFIKQHHKEYSREHSTDASSIDNDEFRDLKIPTREEIESDIRFVSSKIRNMIKLQKELNIEEKADLLNMLHKKEVNFRISEELKTISDVKSYAVLKNLSELVNYMITESINDKHNDFRIINNILSSASMIYCRRMNDGQIKGRKEYLTILIKSHALWTETSRWKTWIYWVIEEKKKENLTKKKKVVIEKYRKIKEENYEEEATSGMFSKFISRITKPIATLELENEQKMEIEAIEEEGLDSKTNLNIIFNIMSSYLRFLSQYGIILESAKKIVLYFWERYELDKDRTHLLLSELESTYTKEGLTEKELMQIELEKVRKLNKEMNNDDKCIILYYTSQFLESDIDLIKILQINKNLLSIMKPVIYRRCLVNSAKQK